MPIKDKYDSTFECSRGKTWRMSFTLKLILPFCQKYGKKMEELLPSSLNEMELIELSHIGIQHHADSKGIEFDMWMQDHLDGEAYSMARDATTMGLLNFTLPKLPLKMRVLLERTLKDLLPTVEQSTTQETELEGGLGQTSANSAQTQDKILNNVTTP